MSMSPCSAADLMMMMITMNDDARNHHRHRPHKNDADNDVGDQLELGKILCDGDGDDGGDGNGDGDGGGDGDGRHLLFRQCHIQLSNHAYFTVLLQDIQPTVDIAWYDILNCIFLRQGFPPPQKKYMGGRLLDDEGHPKSNTWLRHAGHVVCLQRERARETDRGRGERQREKGGESEKERERERERNEGDRDI